MSPVRNALVLFLRRLLDPLNLRIVRLAPNKIRGLEPMRDLAFILADRPAPVVFDVGANDGEAAQDFIRAFPHARIVAFEPFVACCDLLHRKFGGQPNVEIHNVALGAAPGESRLNLYSGHRMNSLLTLDDDAGNPMRDSFTPIGSTPVRLEALDRFCAEHGIETIDILKIDTQGYDLEVLKGAVGLLEARQIRTIMLEANFVPMYQRQATFSELHHLLSSFDYRLVDQYNPQRGDHAIDWCDLLYVAPGPPDYQS